MFLKSIKLSNVRGIENISLSFTQDDKGSLRRRTLILGENGMGKSNLLKAIALITAGSDAIGTLLEDPDTWISADRNDCEISATLINQKREERFISLQIRRNDTLKDIIMTNASSLNEIDAALGHSSRNYFVVGYGASRRLSNRSDFSLSERPYRNDRAQNVASLFNLDATLYPLTVWAMEMDYRQPAGIEIIKDALNDLLPTIRFDSIDKRKGRLLFKVGKLKIPLQQLSDGYQNVAAWVGDLLYRITNTFSDFRAPLESRGLLLLDEIDLHLHPKWQRLILEYIAAKMPKFQIIATTHSPLTVQQADIGEVFFLQRNQNGQVELDAFRGNPKQMLVNQLLLSPLFGLTTDESTDVQQLKEEYRTLKQRKSPTVADRQRLLDLSDKLEQLPPVQRSNFTIDKEQLDLITEVRNELSNRKK